MKTTLEISDALLDRAKRHARKVGKPLRAVVEDGLRRLLDSESVAPRYRLPDRSVGRASDSDPLEALSWQDVRELTYGGR